MDEPRIVRLDSKDKSTTPQSSVNSSEYSSETGNSQSSPQSDDRVEQTRPIIGLQSEMIDAPVSKIKESSVFIHLTLPTAALVSMIVGVNIAGESLLPKFKLASVYGGASGYNFDETTRFSPGDYSIVLVYNSPEEARSVISAKILLQHEPISNLMVSQLIFGLYRALGFEPSHIMRYPVRSSSSGSPFYRKIHSEISKVSEALTPIKAASERIESKLSLVTGQVESPRPDLTPLQEQINELMSKPGPDLTPLQEQINELMKKTDPTPLQEQINELMSKPGPDLTPLNTQINELMSRPNLDLTPLQTQLAKLSERVERLAHPTEIHTVTVEQIQEKLNEIEVYLRQQQVGEKGTNEPPSVPIEVFEQMVLEKEKYFNKLKEAEDYIDQLSTEDEPHYERPRQKKRSYPVTKGNRHSYY